MTIKNLEPSSDGQQGSAMPAQEAPAAARQETVLVHKRNEDVAEQRSSGGPAAGAAAQPSQPAGMASSRTVVRDEVSGGRDKVAQINQIIWFAVGFLEVLLALRLVLKMLGAGPTAGFTQIVTGVTSPFVAPFLGIFPNAGVDVFEFEPATVVAMLVYLLLGVGLVKVVRIMYGETRQAA